MRTLPFALAPLALALPLTALADETERKPAEIVITADRSPQTAGVNNAYVQIISGAEIKSSGAQTVTDVLRRAAVLQVVDQTGDGSSPQVGMRGFGGNGSQNVLILLDGRRLNNETDLGTVNLRNISLDDVDHVEIVNGSSGALYGAGAVGGIINIVTRAAEGNQLDLSIGRGSYDTDKYKARATARQGAWSMIVNGDKELSDNYRDNNALNSSFGQVKLAYDDNNKSGYIETSNLRQHVGYAGSLNDLQLAQNRRQSSTPLNYGSSEGSRLSVGGGVRINDDWRLNVDSSFRKDDLTSFYASFGTPFAQTREQLTLSPRLQGRFRIGERTARLTLGQDLEQGRYEAFGSIGKPVTNSTYAQLSVPLTQSLELTTGYRHGRHHNDISFTPKISDSVNAGSIGVFWTASDTFKAWLRADQNFRFGSIDEQTFTKPGTTLKTQTGVSYEAGVEKRLASHVLRLQAYELNLRNEIALDPSGCIFYGCNINLDATQRRGINASWSAPLSARMDAGLQLNMVDGKFTAGSVKGNQIPHVPRHAVTGSLTWRPLEATTVALETQYTGSKFADNDYDNNNRKVKAVLLHNLALTQKWRNMTASMRLNNLLNEKYDLYTIESGAGALAHYPAAGRNVMFTLAYSFK